MNITYVITGLHGDGAETMLLKILERLDRKTFKPTVISLTDRGDIGPRIEALGIPVLALGMRSGIPNPFLLFRLMGYLQRSQPDVVHTWMYHADLLGGLAARLIGCRHVLWGIRHSNLSPQENKRTTLLVAKLCALLSSWVPERILSCSHKAERVHGAFGYQVSKIQVIPNGFDLRRFAPDALARAGLREELGVGLETPLVGMVARYDPQKNHLGFVTAAAHLQSLCPEVHFVLAGAGVDGHNRVLMAAIASHAGLAGAFHLLGRREDIPRLMAALDVLASPSSGEAFPNVLGEAMAAGVPCVVTDVGDSAEIVGVSGRVVPVGDMVGLAREVFDLLSQPPDARRRLGGEARQRVQTHYEIGLVTRLYEATYQALLV